MSEYEYTSAEQAMTTEQAYSLAHDEHVPVFRYEEDEQDGAAEDGLSVAIADHLRTVVAGLRAELDQQHTDRAWLVEVIEVLDRQVTEGQAAVDRYRGTAEQAQSLAFQRARELETFKEAVVNEALDIQREMNWCNEGLRRHLANLGLRAGPQCWSGIAYVEVSFSGVEVDDDEDVDGTISDLISRAVGSLYGSGLDGWELSSVEAEEDEQ